MRTIVRLALAIFIGALLGGGIRPQSPRPAAADPATGGLLFALQDEAGATTIHRFRVNEATGALTRIGTPLPTDGNGDGGEGADRLAYDPFNHRLYVLSDGSDDLRIYRVDPITGDLTNALAGLPTTYIGLGVGSWRCLAVHGTRLVVGGFDSVAVSNVLRSYDLRADGVTLRTNAGTGLADPFSCRFSPDGGRVFTGGYTANAVAIFTVGTDATLASIAGSPFIRDAAGPGSYAFSPTGQLLAAGFFDGDIIALNQDGSAFGATASPGPFGPYSGVSHPNGYYYLSSGVGGNAVHGYRFRPFAVPTFVAIPGSPFSVGGTAPGSLVLNATGGFLLAANRSSRNISAFAVDPATGALSVVATQPANTLGTGGSVTGLVYAPPPPATGGLLFTLENGFTNQIHRYRIDESTGIPYPLGAPTPTGSGGSGDDAPSKLAYDRANRRLYAANNNVTNPSISSFRVDLATGALTTFAPIQTLTDAPLCLAVHPSGSPLIAMTNAPTGRLLSYQVSGSTLTEVSNVTTGILSLSPPICVLSPDGSYFYTRGSAPGSIAVFAVNSAIGTLTPIAGSPFLPAPLTGIDTMTIDRSGNLFVSNGGTGHLFPTVGGAPQAGVSTAITPATNRALALANGIIIVGVRSNPVAITKHRVGTSPLSLTEFGGVATIPSFAVDLAVTDSEAFLYSTHSEHRTLSIYRHNAGSPAGTLPVLVSTLLRNTFGTTGTTGGIAYAAPPPPTNGGLLFAFGAAIAGDRIHQFRVDETNGRLFQSGASKPTGGNTDAALGHAIQYLAYDPVGLRLFAISQNPPQIAAYTVDPLTGALSALPYSPIAAPFQFTGDAACLAVHPSGSPIVVGGLNAGIPQYQLQSIQISASAATPAGGPVLINNGSRPVSCLFSADGAYLYAGGENGSLLSGYAVAPATGALTPLSGSPFDSGIGYPRALAADPTGRLFGTYWTPLADPQQGSGRVNTTAGGTPTGLPALALGPTEPRQGLLNPNGYYLVAGGRDVSGVSTSPMLRNFIGVFKITGSGAGTTLSIPPGAPYDSLANGTNTIAQNRAGTIIFAGSSLSRTITSFGLDPATGYLTPIGRLPERVIDERLLSLVFVPAPADLTVSLTHGGAFAVGGSGTVTAQVRNAVGAAPTLGPIDVTITLPTGLGFTSAGGTGWSCTPAGATISCRHDGPAGGLPAGASLPDLPITVGVPGPAGAVNVAASVASAGEFPRTNNSATDSITIAGQSQAITFGALADRPIDTPLLLLTATSSSGLPVSFASGTPTVCTVSGATVTLVTTGTCTITASQPGNGSYAPAADVSRSFAIIPGFRIQYLAGMHVRRAIE